MADEANDAQTGSPQPEPQVEVEPQPSDEQVIQALIGTETRGDPRVTKLVNKLKFSRRQESQLRPNPALHRRSG
jgi:hypothetical protein